MNLPPRSFWFEISHFEACTHNVRKAVHIMGAGEESIVQELACFIASILASGL